MKESGGFTLGGREFKAVGVQTIEHDLYFLKVARSAGLTEKLELEEGETPDDFARRLLGMIIDSGCGLEIVACVLVPKDDVRPWSTTMAKETAAFIGGLTGAEDKKQINDVLISVIVGFFTRGLTSLWTSPASSRGKGDQPVRSGISGASGAM